eukprot:s6840_g1.t1
MLRRFVQARFANAVGLSFKVMPLRSSHCRLWNQIPESDESFLLESKPQAPEETKDAVHTDSLGEILALASAAMFGFCSVALETMSSRHFDPGLFLGLNGLVAAALSPAALGLAHLLEVEQLRLPSMSVVRMLLLNALLGCICANYLYAFALLRLSPVLATASLSLSIPISAAVDEAGGPRILAVQGLREDATVLPELGS